MHFTLNLILFSNFSQAQLSLIQIIKIKKLNQFAQNFMLTQLKLLHDSGVLSPITPRIWTTTTNKFLNHKL